MLIAINPGLVTRDGLKGFRCMVQGSFAGTRLKTRAKGETSERVLHATNGRNSGAQNQAELISLGE